MLRVGIFLGIPSAWIFHQGGQQFAKTDIKKGNQRQDTLKGLVILPDKKRRILQEHGIS